MNDLGGYWSQAKDAALSRASAGGGSPFVESESFPKQWEYVTTNSRFNALKCSRRAGKTNGSAFRTAKLNTERPGRRVLYINLTALNADLQFYQPLTEFLRGHNVPFKGNASNLLAYWTNGSFMRAMGCDNLGEVKTKLGDRWDEIIIDEMQSYADDVLRELIDRAAMPTLVDRGGGMTLQGTPPVTLAGYWYKVLTDSPFTKFGWTLFDNPFIKHDIDEILKSRGLKLTDPIVRREYFGEICVDPEAVVFRYESPRNDMPAGGRPEPDHHSWRYTLGVDLGFGDADAMVVLGWRMDDPAKRLWECYAWQESGLDYLKTAAKFREVCERFKPQGICIDTGGHGARKIMESLKSVFPAFNYQTKPTSVLDSIALVNDEFRSGRLLVEKDGLIAHDAALVVWKEGKHGVEVSETFHSDIMAALRYAHSVAYHYRAQAPKAEESDEERRIRQWMRRREVEMDPFNPYRN